MNSVLLEDLNMMQQSYTPTQVYFHLFYEPSAQYEGGIELSWGLLELT